MSAACLRNHSDNYKYDFSDGECLITKDIITYFDHNMNEKYDEDIDDVFSISEELSKDGSNFMCCILAG